MLNVKVVFLPYLFCDVPQGPVFSTSSLCHVHYRSQFTHLTSFSKSPSVCRWYTTFLFLSSFRCTHLHGACSTSLLGWLLTSQPVTPQKLNFSSLDSNSILSNHRISLNTTHSARNLGYYYCWKFILWSD